jgi:hypothetical protein
VDEQNIDFAYPGDVIHARKLDVFGSWDLPGHVSGSCGVHETIIGPVKNERRDPDRWKDLTDVDLADRRICCAHHWRHRSSLATLGRGP